MILARRLLILAGLVLVLGAANFIILEKQRVRQRYDKAANTV